MSKPNESHIAAELRREWATFVFYDRSEKLFMLRVRGEWKPLDSLDIKEMIAGYLEAHPLMRRGYKSTFISGIETLLKSSLRGSRDSPISSRECSIRWQKKVASP